MCKTSDNSISFGVGLLFGILAGVAGGILLSPKPGEEMRNDVKNAIDCVIKTDNNDIIQCKSASITMINKLKYTIENQITKINEAVKAGRMAAAKRKEELDSGYNY